MEGAFWMHADAGWAKEISKPVKGAKLEFQRGLPRRAAHHADKLALARHCPLDLGLLRWGDGLHAFKAVVTPAPVHDSCLRHPGLPDVLGSLQRSDATLAWQ